MYRILQNFRLFLPFRGYRYRTVFSLMIFSGIWKLQTQDFRKVIISFTVQVMLIQRLLAKATQPSPVKAMYPAEELESAALAVCQYLASAAAAKRANLGSPVTVTNGASAPHATTNAGGSNSSSSRIGEQDAVQVGYHETFLLTWREFFLVVCQIFFAKKRGKFLHGGLGSIDTYKFEEFCLKVAVLKINFAKGFVNGFH
jgi:hypothetical protein